MLAPGDRVRVLLPGTADVWTGTVMDSTNLDTWPTLAGEYHPRPPGGIGWTLVRYDGWPDDLWHCLTTVERIPG
jgi:hypothetical protein